MCDQMIPVIHAASKCGIYTHSAQSRLTQSR